MDLKEAVLLFAFTILIIGSFFYLLSILSSEKSPKYEENDCLWNVGDCRRICTIGKFYFDGGNGFCKPWTGNNCCLDAPFDTLTECQATCE